MSYIQNVDLYAYLVQSGQLPPPNAYYPSSISYIPNISNEGCDNRYYADVIRNYYQNYSCNYCYPEYYGNLPYQNPANCLDFTTTRLVSNVANAAIVQDSGLIDPWGLLISNNIIWVASQGNGLLCAYDLPTGEIANPAINVFTATIGVCHPTGIAFNANRNAFKIYNGNVVSGSTLLTATLDGTVHGFNPAVDPFNAIVLIDNSLESAIYTDIAVVNYVDKIDRDTNTVETFNVIYLTDFSNKKVVAYNSNLELIPEYEFIDQYSSNPIPDDYGPYGIKYINEEYLYVTYAKQNPDIPTYPEIGAGLGYINIFDRYGNFVKRFHSGGPLNVPWSVISAPSNMMYPAGTILVGNFGSGYVAVFDQDGKYLGNMSNANGNDLCLMAIRGLAVEPKRPGILYWTSSDNSFSNSYLGYIDYKRYNYTN